MKWKLSGVMKDYEKQRNWSEDKELYEQTITPKVMYIGIVGYDGDKDKMKCLRSMAGVMRTDRIKNE